MSLNIIADESVDYRIVKKLRDVGIETFSISEEHKGIGDEKVIEITQEKKAFLLTEDSDFGEWVFAHKTQLNCVIFLRYHHERINEIFNSLHNVLLKYGVKLMDKFIVITPTKIRMRDIIE